MKEIIESKLKEIELTENVRILLAVESGSRAWGFASPDSDYDVRFIYVRKRSDYLKLEGIRDVIELPIDEVLDINGWDITKALKLLYKSNPTLIEWFTSPIVYRRDDEFLEKMKPLIKEYFSSKNELYHYLSMAESNFKKFLQGEMVKAKSYFYVLRPVLACMWILDKETPPPMLFEELVKAELPEELKDDVDRLLDIKMNSPEIKMIPRVDVINSYLGESIDEVKRIILSMDEPANRSWDSLNQFFLSEISE
ncbi:MAG: nucleotidyltransferase domain-containing protein [Oscillospiraceae bacterium]|nr:nucleotidyltransferase domain-containing protein [Oscillospiraceae bacterium]